MRSSFSSFVKRVLVRLGVGSLVDHKSGKDTRKDLTVKVDELKDQGRDYADLAMEKGTEVTHTSKDAATNVRKSLVDSSKKLRSTLSDAAQEVQHTTEEFVSEEIGRAS